MAGQSEHDSQICSSQRLFCLGRSWIAQQSNYQECSYQQKDWRVSATKAFVFSETDADAHPVSDSVTVAQRVSDSVTVAQRLSVAVGLAASKPNSNMRSI